MKLSLSNTCITLTIGESCPNYEEVKNSLLKFSKSFWINNTLINLYCKKEIWERKKFLLNLYKLCAYKASTNNGHFLKRLIDSYDKPIKFVVMNSTSPIKVISLDFKVHGKALHVKLSEDEKFMFWYFVNFFRKYTASYDIQKKSIVISQINLTLRKELFALFSKQNILGNQMQYNFNKHELNYLFNNLTANFYTQTSAPTISYYCKILNVNENDSFETIRKHYLRLAKRFHPDHQNALTPQEVKINTQRFYKIQEAYEALKNFKHEKVAA